MYGLARIDNPMLEISDFQTILLICMFWYMDQKML